jgi:LmbE family N-acetylglucosaminyl deacetylase
LEQEHPPLLERLTGRSVTKVAVIVAHPDDEAIGAGAHLGSWPDVTAVFATNGSPKNLRYANDAGYADRENYAKARMAEAAAALKLAGVAAPPVFLGFDDQDTARELPALIKAIAKFIAGDQPDVIVTHPYEGGHPDHDAVCIAVHLACEVIRRQGEPFPAIVEMTSYFARGGRRVSCEFKNGENGITVPLTAGQAELKSRIYQAHASQYGMLKDFPLEQECFRLAPQHDFRRVPPGEILYATTGMGILPDEFERLAASAVNGIAGRN